MRVSGHKAVQRLFGQGKALFIYPFRVVFIQRMPPDGNPVRLLVSVSRRNFKRSVDRNLLKRRIKEGWRRNIHSYTPKLNGYDVGLVYVSKRIEDFPALEDKIILTIERLIQSDESGQ